MLSSEELNKLREYLEKSLGAKIRPRKIKGIRVNSAYHWQPPLHIQVGGYCSDLEKDSPKEKIVAIFEATTFLVCTAERGVSETLPYFFSKEDVQRVEEMP